MNNEVLSSAVALGYKTTEKTKKYLLLEKNKHRLYFYKSGEELRNVSVGWKHLKEINKVELLNYENNTVKEAENEEQPDINILENLKENEIFNYIFKLEELEDLLFLEENEFDFIKGTQPFSQLFYKHQGSIAIPLFSEDEQLKDILIFNKKNIWQLFGVNNLFNSTKKIENGDEGGYLFFHPYTMIKFFNENMFDDEENHIIAGNNFNILLNPETTNIIHLGTYHELVNILKYVYIIANSHYNTTGIYFDFFVTMEKAVLRINYAIEKIKPHKTTKLFNDIKAYIKEKESNPDFIDVELTQKNFVKKDSKFSKFVISGIKSKDLLNAYLEATTTLFEELNIPIPGIRNLSYE